MLSGEHYWSSPFPELQVRGKSELIRLTQIKKQHNNPRLSCAHGHTIFLLFRKASNPSTTPGHGVHIQKHSVHATRAGQEDCEVLHSKPSACREVICPNTFFTNWQEIFFAPNLTKYVVTILCRCPISSSSDFDSAPSDLARGKRCYLKKAEFLLILHAQPPSLQIQIRRSGTFTVATAEAVRVPG